MKGKNFRLYASLLLQIILGFLFLAAGAGKFLAREMWIQKFSNWGYPDHFYLLIGVVEIVAALLLFIPKFAKYAALTLVIIMLGALFTHIFNQELGELFRPGIFLVLLSTLIFLKRGTKPGSTRK